MKIYEGYSSSPDGWNVSSTLELEDDGRFSYSEGWTDYTNASLSGGAGGTWRRDEGDIVFLTEKIYDPIYFPWVRGGEVRAVVRDRDLDFGRGWTLSQPPDHFKEIPVRNDTAKPKPLVLEPWGIRQTLAPGESVRIVTQVPRNFWEQQLRVEYGADEIVFRGSYWTWATIVPDTEPTPPPTPPQQSKPPAPPRASNAEAAEPSSKPPTPTAEPTGAQAVEPPSKPPAPSPAKAPAAPFVPRAPSPELAALIRRWVDELPPQAPGNSINRLCKENDAIPLDCTEIYLWVLRTDGQVLCIDHESFAQRAEPEENAEVAYGMIELGAGTHPELLELLPPERRAGQTDE
jgi:hypothetical protein